MHLELPVIADILSAHESHLENLKEERWKRLTLKQSEPDEGDQSDAEVLGVCHRPGCAVPDMGCAKNTDWSECSEAPCGSQVKGTALASHVRCVKCRGFDDSIQALAGSGRTGMGRGR